MSSYKAIGAVSSTLRTLLLDRMENPQPVTIAPPGVQVTDVSGKRVNLFLYRLTENGFLKNQEIPGRGHPAAYGHPPLSIDLHYLVSVYDPNEENQMAETADLESQEILGDVMRVLHDFAIIDSGLMKANTLPAGPILDPALLNEFEKVKLCLEPIGIEDLTNVWTALTSGYRLSVGYQVSVVQIESLARRAQALPVQVRNIYVQTFRTPHILEAYRQPPLNNFRMPVVAVGETLRIVGTNLAGAATRVALGGVNIPVPVPGDEQIEIVVPGVLDSGVHAVRVVHDLAFGTPADPHRGFSSNAVSVVLIPTIVNITPPSPPGAASGSTLTVMLNPPARLNQQVTLLLGDRAVPAQPPPLGLTTQRLAPEAILAQSNLAGMIDQIKGYPDAPGTGWLIAANNNVDVDVRVSFPTPSGNPAAAPVLQEFRALVRKTANSGSGTPTARIELWESGALRLAGPTFNVGDGGTVIAMSWDAATLATANGSQVEASVVGIRSGGVPAAQAAVDVGAVEWNANALRANVSFTLPAAPGEHLVRVRVDGAESRLNFDPLTNTFTGPKYVVT